jgi:hypothetical protein
MPNDLSNSLPERKIRKRVSPQKPGGNKIHHIMFRVTKDQRDTIHEMAGTQGITITKLILESLGLD